MARSRMPSLSVVSGCFRIAFTSAMLNTSGRFFLASVSLCSRSGHPRLLPRSGGNDGTPNCRERPCNTPGSEILPVQNCEKLADMFIRYSGCRGNARTDEIFPIFRAVKLVGNYCLGGKILFEAEKFQIVPDLTIEICFFRWLFYERRLVLHVESDLPKHIARSNVH